jgi:phosphoglycerate dehydrogenase-like enzyme
MLGADVAAWDPYASEPCFHRSGAQLITAELIHALPRGCLVVLATRAKICDTEALLERVLHDEICLAADVFDIEPLPLDHPLLGRHNVVHTPHNAGRTVHANQQWAELLTKQFERNAKNKQK